MSSPGQRIQTFCPAKKLGEYIRFLKDQEGESNFVTFLIGAGFSKSAGIPLAGEIVEDLKKEAEHHPLLRNAGKAPKNTSEYVHLMEKLGSPKERAKRIKRYIDKARDTEGRLKINWSHLLLATLVEKGYVNRILTTNFDPLVVEALALSGQPIRTYDLNTTGAYYPGTLDAGSVIYLHGQMHSLLLVNSGHEMDKMAALYPPVLQEAVQNSILITVGYSGDCDPVLDGLLNLPNFPRGIWWSQYGKIEDAPCDAMQRLSEKFGTDCHLAIGDDSDTFMRKLVLDGMKLDLPDEVMTPLAAMRKTLERITPYPQGDTPASDPVPSAIELLKRFEEQLSPATPASGKDKKSETPVGNSNGIKELSLVPAIEMAALNGNWEEFHKLTEKLKPSKGSRLAQTIADGLINQASETSERQPDRAIELLKKAKDLGPSAKMSGWLPVVWGNVHLVRAKTQGNSPEADRFYMEAEERYAEALRIKPDMHPAVSNWGTALLAQAKAKGNSPEADRLYQKAGEKYAEALRIKPDKHEAVSNWGTALLAQAKTKGNSPEADRLYRQAGEKYAEALRIKPDMHEAISNWGIALVAQAQTKGNSPEADQLYQKAGEKYAKVLRIKPDDHETTSNWGTALFAQAQTKGNSPEADRLFKEAGEKYAGAFCIKPDAHDAAYGWGNALLFQAKARGNSPEAYRLYNEAGEKYAEALRIKPDKDEAAYNWGNALLAQAKTQGNSPEADQLYKEAGEKYAEALRIKPDKRGAIYNLACLHSLTGDIDSSLGHLINWKALSPKPTRSMLDNDPDFDKIRDHPDFIAFRDSLPE